MLLIGLGAPAFALLHLVAHSLYKAHAFLSSADLARRATRHASPAPLAAAVAVVAGMASFVLVGRATGLWEASVTAATRAGIFSLGMAPLVARRGGEHALAPWFRALSIPAAVAVVFLAMERVGGLAFGGAFGSGHASNVVAVASLIAMFVLGVASFVSWQRPTTSSRLYRAVWVHARNGFYFSILFDRAFEMARARSVPVLPLRTAEGKYTP